MTLNMPYDAFGLYYAYYDLLYRDKDYNKEGHYVAEILRRHNPGAQTILELGSGTGNYSKILANLGFIVTGIEQNERMMSLAKAKSIPDFNGLVDNIVFFETDIRFDAVVSLFHVISYLNYNEEIKACFKRTAQHLKPRGIFIFDVWYTPAVYTQRPAARMKRVENEVVEIVRFAQPSLIYEENRVEVKYQLFIKDKSSGHYEALNEIHSLRHFSTPEISLFAEEAGFSVIETEEFLTAKSPCADTWGVCYILQKND